MKKLNHIIFFVLMIFSANSFAQEKISVLDFDGLKPLLHQQNDTVYVVNFWATWCKPCVEELPAFNQAAERLEGQPVQFLFVSLDFAHHIEKRVKPFLKENPINGRVVLLDDPKAHIWIDQVNKNWSGAIPATLIYNAEQRRFYEQGFTFEELMSELEYFVKP